MNEIIEKENITIEDMIYVIIKKVDNNVIKTNEFDLKDIVRDYMFFVKLSYISKQLCFFL